MLPFQTGTQQHYLCQIIPVGRHHSRHHQNLEVPVRQEREQFSD